MRVYITSLFVDDQDKAEAFYTQTLGFKVKHNLDLGAHRWLTLVSSEDEAGTEVLLEPSTHTAVNPYRQALKKDGIPAHSFQVQNLQNVFEDLSAKGVKFVQEPVDAGTVLMAIFDDTCGNLIQLIQFKDL